MKRAYNTRHSDRNRKRERIQEPIRTVIIFFPPTILQNAGPMGDTGHNRGLAERPLSRPECEYVNITNILGPCKNNMGPKKWMDRTTDFQITKKKTIVKSQRAQTAIQVKGNCNLVSFFVLQFPLGTSLSCCNTPFKSQPPNSSVSS